jgi:hypothetical protein
MHPEGSVRYDVRSVFFRPARKLVKMVEIRFVAYLRQWRKGGSSVSHQRRAVRAVVEKYGGTLMEEYIEAEKGRWSWRNSDRPQLREALAKCKEKGYWLVSFQWGAMYRDERMNEIIRRWNESSCGRFLDAGTVPPYASQNCIHNVKPALECKVQARKRPRIGPEHGFANPKRSDVETSQKRGLQTQMEQHQRYWDEIRPMVETGVRMGYDSPQELQRYLDEQDVKTFRGKRWSRQAAANLLKRVHGSE